MLPAMNQKWRKRRKPPKIQGMPFQPHPLPWNQP
nr:MAG TPA: hypothetical protein [Caudoviricetes sp.]DAZ77169.1 MAG TPA: hypothetical protein [Caudoviricetes sp.]